MTINQIASFPDGSHRQYFIASSMKYSGGRPGRSGHVRCHQVARHMVDTRRAVPNEESRRPVLYCPSNGWISERSKGRQSIPFIVHNAGDGSTQNRYFNGWAPPPVCLPSVYQTSLHVTRSPVFHTGSDEILAVGTAWERGYKSYTSS